MVLKLISLNCWLLPPPFSSENGKRLDGIIDWIKKSDPDIVVLQEVWMKAYIERLHKSLNGYNCVYSKSGLYNRTGLFTATKVKVVSSEIVSFPTRYNLNLIELAARKGYHRIDLGDFILFNVHLYAPIKKKENNIVSEQFSLIKHLAEKEKLPTIVVGDFNLTLEQINIQKDRTYKVIDGNGAKTIDNSNPYTSKYFNKFNKTFDAIDHILVFGKGNRVQVSQNVITNPIFSDHFILEVTIKIESNSTL